tara:strand:- start:4965 stop:5864 length:900 start_codon:yes stop_codon:yes gene_type:complete
MFMRTTSFVKTDKVRSDYEEIASSEENSVGKAQKYYDSNSADRYYFNIWGGEHIHVGIYFHENEPIKDASPRIVHMMASQVGLSNQTKVLDIGSGYGGGARFLAKTFGCRVTCLNLSHTQNERNESFNKDQGLMHKIEVVQGNFEDMPFPNESFDIIWSQDAIVHSSNREKVITEVSRLLRKNGNFIFTDLMQSSDCPKSALKPVLERIHLQSLGSFGYYFEVARKSGLKKGHLVDLSSHLTTHYKRVLDETQKRYDEMIDVCGKNYIDTMIKGLGHWVEAGKKGYLAWGIMNLSKIQF